MHRGVNIHWLPSLLTLIQGIAWQPLHGQARAPYVGFVGVGLAVQRRSGNLSETANGYTLVGGLSRRLTPAVRLHADVRYSFDLSTGSYATSPCPGTCPPSGFAATRIVSTALSTELLTSPRTVGVLLRAGGGVAVFLDPAPGRTGTYPSLGAAAGLRFPLGPRTAFIVEGRYERLLGVAIGPHVLWSLLLGGEL